MSRKCIQRSFEKTEKYQKVLKGKYFFHTKECYHFDYLSFNTEAFEADSSVHYLFPPLQFLAG